MNKDEGSRPKSDVLLIHSPNSSQSRERRNGRSKVGAHSGSQHSATEPSVLPAPPPKPDRVWVRHLLSSRRRARKEGPVNNWHSGVSANSDEAWLRTQRDALTSGTLSVTLKCVLAAAEISPIFSVHATDFQKPEYRTHYWVWCKRFIKLVDFVTDDHRSDPNACQNVPDAFEEMPAFVRNMRDQRAQGLLPQPKEALLSALGVRWSPQPGVDSDNSNSASKRGHEGEKGSEHPGSSNSDRGRESERKRRRSEADNGADKNEPKGSDKNNSSRQAMKKWAAEFVKLRTYFRSTGASQGRYEVPVEAADVRIWQNAETARVSTGGSSIYCYAILKSANVIDDSVDHSFKPGREISYWCLLFVQLVDCVIEKRVHSSHNIRTFLARCCSTEHTGQLPPALQGLLEGALPPWRKMGLLTARPQGSRPTVTFADPDAASKPPLKASHAPSVAHPMEKEMVTTMIKGLVAECVAGEKKTLEQRQAEEWVSKAGVDALNRYARSWVRKTYSD